MTPGGKVKTTRRFEGEQNSKMNFGEYFYREADTGKGSAVSTQRGSPRKTKEEFKKPTKRLTISEYKQICDKTNQNFMATKLDYYMQGKTLITDVLMGSKQQALNEPFVTLGQPTIPEAPVQGNSSMIENTLNASGHVEEDTYRQSVKICRLSERLFSARKMQDIEFN